MGQKARMLSSGDRHGSTSTRKMDRLDAGLKEPCLCPECRSVYQQRRWTNDPAAAEMLALNPEVQQVLCPACRKVAERYPKGLLKLAGGYFLRHEAEIRNMLDNEAERLQQRNPLERIMRMEREGDALVIETTDQKLAEHLGRAVERAHNGELHIDWAGDACRVEWMRVE